MTDPTAAAPNGLYIPSKGVTAIVTNPDEGQGCPANSLQEQYDPFSEPQRDDPFPVWRTARRECPVFYSDKLSAWAVARYHDVVDVLSDHESYSSVGASSGFSDLCPEARQILDRLPSPAETDIVPTDPPRHTKMRRFIQLSFLPRRITNLEPIIREFAHELLDAVEARGECDFYTDFAYPYPLSVVTSLVGIPRADGPRIKAWVEASLSLKWTRLTPAQQVNAATARAEYFGYLRDFVAHRRAARADDFVGALVTHSEESDDPLTETEMMGQVASLMSAGHETTANFLTMTLDRFLSERAIWESLVSDPALIPQLIEESLRLNGPVQGLWRTTTRQSVVAGVDVPAGARLTALIGSANRDEEVFDEPERFRADRPNVRRHMAFGRGIHSCAGSNLARMETRIALEVLAQRMPELRRVHQGPLSFEPSALQRAPRELRLAWG
jgi:cytochrome P450